MDIKEVWQALKQAKFNDTDLLNAFSREVSPYACIKLLEERDADKARIAELEAQLMQAEMDRDAYKRGAAIAENRLKTAKRDAILEAANNDTLFCKKFEESYGWHCSSVDIINYANAI